MTILAKARRSAARGLVGAFVGGAALAAGAGPASASLLVSDDPALYWSSLVAKTVTGSPVLTSRSVAMAQTAIYEAANATTGANYRSYLGFGKSAADTRVAVAVAARNVLVKVNPARTADYDAALAATLALVPDSPAKASAISLGEKIASAAIANRTGDGSTLTVPYMPQPPGTPGAWQPTPGAFLPGALPQWGDVKPWVMSSAASFLAPPPPALSSLEYASAFNEVKEWGSATSALRTADQTLSARLFATASASGLSPWEELGIGLAQSKGLGTTDSARMLALLALSNADSLIASWDSKYHYDFWRPVTAIRNADIDGNALTAQDAGWSSLINNPNYPSHASGYAALAGSATSVLSSFFGDANAFCLENASGKLCFDSFSQAAQIAADSRLYGGIHFRFETEAGLAQGRSIGRLVTSSALGAVPEPSTWLMLIAGFGLLGSRLRQRRAPGLVFA
jgi:hypothetical protein